MVLLYFDKRFLFPLLVHIYCLDERIRTARTLKIEVADSTIVASVTVLCKLTLNAIVPAGYGATFPLAVTTDEPTVAAVLEQASSLALTGSPVSPSRRF